MIDEIKQALAEVMGQFADKRTHVCQMEVTAVTDGRITLAGTVLDEATLTAVLAHLAATCPEYALEASAVTILRQPAYTQMVVCTTITGLHNSPGFLSEPGSYLLNGMLVEPLQADGRWLFVRQEDGYLGWAYAPYLGDAPSAAPTHLVCEPVALLRQEPDERAGLENRVLAGTAVVVTNTQNGWQQITWAGLPGGWLPAAHLRPLTDLPQAAAAQRAQLIADAPRFTGVPYLWAGVSGYGIDCSGYVQLLYRLAGVTLPRDADMMFAAGQPVEPPYRPGDLFFFGSESGHRHISHVGMSLGGWQMIHSSRSRNGVFVDDVTAVNHLRDTFAGARSFLGD
ncbi:MAG: C40 family peptidase [Anaerolineae bacterium]|nr:C40 family peptidase [Anaerolineae bacterium]